jgi:hypothetical protein
VIRRRPEKCFVVTSQLLVNANDFRMGRYLGQATLGRCTGAVIILLLFAQGEANAVGRCIAVTLRVQTGMTVEQTALK